MSNGKVLTKAEELQFKKKLEELINSLSIDSWCDTRDFLLADYLFSCASNYRMTVKRGKELDDT